MTKKISSAARHLQSDLMAQSLLALGFMPYQVDEGGVCATGKLVHIMVEFPEDKIYFGLASTFSKWGNSRDYVFSGIPSSDDVLASVVEKAKELASRNIERDSETLLPINLNALLNE